VNRKYRRLETGRRTFAARKGKSLRLYTETPIIRHIKVAGNRSPYEGDRTYWGARLGRYPTLSGWKALLLKKQKGRCSVCKLQFVLGDDMDTDHNISLYLGGKDIWANIQLLHAHCHFTKPNEDS